MSFNQNGRLNLTSGGTSHRVLNCYFGSSTVTTSNSGVLTCGNNTDVVVENCSFIGGGQTNVSLGVLNSTSSEMRIAKCYFSNVNGTAIYFNGGHATIRDCYIDTVNPFYGTTTTGRGIAIYYPTGKVNISGCKINNSSEDGIYATGNSGSQSILEPKYVITNK
jgi:hypothetical protein